MKLFLTGASGLLGHSLAASFLDAGWDVHMSAHARRPKDKRSHIHEIDLSQIHVLGSLLEDLQPEAIINAAALTVPSDCEKNPERSKALNLQLPETLARYASRTEAHLIHYSSDMVFDGKGGNYTPACSTSPTNLYGRHKLASENRVQELCPRACVIRLPLLMGNSPAGTRSVHEALWKAWSHREPTPLFEDEWRTPVSASNVASLTKELLSKPHIQGLYHWAGATYINRWKMGNLIAEKLHVPKNLLRRTLARDFPQFKDRPLNLTMDCSKLKALVQTVPAPFAMQLAELRAPTL